MTVNPSPMKRAFVCPLCGEAIDAMEPNETAHLRVEGFKPEPGENFLQAMARERTQANMEANEALIWAHFTSYHNLHEAVLALGQARNALMEIRDQIAKCDGTGHLPWMPEFLRNDLGELIDHGLGHK